MSTTAQAAATGSRMPRAGVRGQAQVTARSGLAAIIEARLLKLLVEQNQAGLRATASVIIMTILVAPFLAHTNWIVWIVMTRAVALAICHYFVIQLMTEMSYGDPTRQAIRRLAIANGVAAFIWGAITWPLEIGSSIDFMSFLIVVISLFSICLSVVSAGLHRLTLTATMIGGALGLAPKIAILTPQIGVLLPIGFAIFVTTIYAYARLISRQALVGVLIQLRGERTAERLARTNKALEEALDLANWLADRDALTELRNRRAFESELAPLFDRFPHRQHCLLLLDIDHFKRINDRFGHETGDGVLVAIGTALRQWEAATGGRLAGRWGGEEFIAVVALRKDETMHMVAEDLRRRIEVLSDQLHWPSRMQLTTSIGCTRLSRLADFDMALFRADGALYAAKDSGRNCWKLAA